MPLFDSTAAQITLFDSFSTLSSFIWIFIFPGIVWASLVNLPHIPDRATAIAVRYAVGAAIWPLLLLWTSFFGWRWTPVSARIVLIVAGGAGFFLLWLKISNSGLSTIWRRLNPNWIVVGVLLFIASVWTRLLHVENLVLPNWVDSVHHAMIIRLIADQGTIPETFAPFMPEGRFFYHWGYHANMAWLTWARGNTDPFDAARVMLTAGQIYSAMSVLMLYVAGRWLFASRRAGLLAAIFGGLVSWFPAYYVSWGRYTHLAGTLFMAPLVVSLWRMHKDGKHGLAWGITSSVLAAGLLLTHVRVAVFVAMFCLVLAIYLVWQGAWRTLAKWLLCAGGALLLTAPWFSRFVNASQVSHLSVLGEKAQDEWWSQLNQLSWGLVWVPGVKELMALASAGISAMAGWGDPAPWLRYAGAVWFCVMVLVLAWYGWHMWKRNHKSLPSFPWQPFLLILAWCGLTAAILNLDRFGLPTIGFLNNNSGVITLFAPLSLFAGGLVAWTTGLIAPRRWVLRVTTALAVTFILWGSYQMRDIVNSTTVLVRAGDMKALEWIRDNTPRDAIFAVNLKRWLGDTYAGTDAGYWISVLTDRGSILPPALYTSVMPYHQVEQMNAFYDGWSQVQDLADPIVRDHLHLLGVTHLYLGTRGGHLLFPSITDSPHTELIYSRDGVHIYTFKE